MKPAVYSLLLAAASPASLSAQTPTPPPATPPGPEVKLTEAQVNTVLAQLKELEKQILDMRGSTLTTVLQRLREGATSDQAAMKLYLDCVRVVSSDRREESKADARKREEAMARRNANVDKKADGDLALATRLQIQYLILTLEAHEAKEEEFKKMIPKLQSFISEVVAAAPMLKGEALARINMPLGGGGGGGGRRGGGGGGGHPIIEAFQLEPYLSVDNWSNRPTDFGGMYTRTILPLAEQDSKSLLPGLWDARINAEGAFRKESMFAPEYELWMKNDLPELRWDRATYLYEKGPEPVTAMSEMLKLIKENPSHASAPAWLQELRTLVQQAAPVQVSEGLTKPAGT